MAPTSSCIPRPIPRRVLGLDRGVNRGQCRFPWRVAPLSATLLLEPQRLHGRRFYETFGDFGLHHESPWEGLRRSGPALSPFFFLFLPSETLNCQHATRRCPRCGSFPRGHNRVEWVSYPALPSAPIMLWPTRFFPLGSGGVLYVRITVGVDAGRRFI